MKKLDYIVYILRAAPFHNGHLSVVKQAHELAEHVIILVGGANRPRTIRNPWTFNERCAMIRSSIPSNCLRQNHIYPLNDYFYDESAWFQEVWATTSHIIRQCELYRGGTRPRRVDEVKIGIIGHQKDKTSGYLTKFPAMEPILVDITTDSNGTRIDATTIRQDMFENKTKLDVSMLPQGSIHGIEQFISTSEFNELCNEYECIKHGKEQWKHSPYTPMFLAADAVVTQYVPSDNNTYVLLITRGSSPGKNLMAIPGGFLEPDEFWECGAYRELVEETQIQLSASVLRANTVDKQVFDHPLRSLRGRMITQAIHIQLTGDQLPRVVGSDDAKLAHWVSLEDIRSDNMFDDHWDIVKYFTKIR